MRKRIVNESSLPGDGAEGPATSTRREFIRRGVAGAAALAFGAPVRGADPAVHTAAGVPNRVRTPTRVVRTKLAAEADGRGPHRVLIRDCLEQGLCRLTDTDDPRDAWHRLLGSADRILVKFNQSGANLLGTTVPLAIELLDSLHEAGWGEHQLFILEAGDASELKGKARVADMRWQGRQVVFGACGSDALMAAVDQADAIINVPFLKTHNLAVMSGCLKNLSHGLVQHPRRFHAGGCDPAIGEISAHPAIRQKLRLNVVNAFRVVFRDGPEARPAAIHDCGMLLVGKDPVACDRIGFDILNQVRSLRKLGPLLPAPRLPPQLDRSAALGTGVADDSRIALVDLPI